MEFGTVFKRLRRLAGFLLQEEKEALKKFPEDTWGKLSGILLTC
jgi:hypothetical protein